MTDDDDQSELRADLIEYLHVNLSSEFQRHIDATYLFGSLVDGRYNHTSDIDVFFVLDDYDYPAKGDINMLGLANDPVAVEQGLGRQRDETWLGATEWGGGPEEALAQLPEYIVHALRSVLVEDFSDGVALRWIDIFFGTEQQLHEYATAVEPLAFPKTE
jgi:hypothetical protein